MNKKCGITVKELLIETIQKLGGDGLWYGDLDQDNEETCGCGFDDFIPCPYFNEYCMAAKKTCDGFIPLEKK